MDDVPFADALGIHVTPLAPERHVAPSPPPTPLPAAPPRRPRRVGETRRQIAEALHAAGGSVIDRVGSSTALLAEQAGLPWPSRSLTRLLASMENDGEIRRDVDHTRTLGIHLTATGRAKYIQGS